MIVKCTLNHTLKRCKSSKGTDYFWKSWICNTYYSDDDIKKMIKRNIPIRCQEKYSNIKYSKKPLDVVLYNKYYDNKFKDIGCVLPECYFRFHILINYGEEPYQLMKMIYLIKNSNFIINLYMKLLPDITNYMAIIYLNYCRDKMKPIVKENRNNDEYPIIHCECDNYCHKIVFKENMKKCNECGDEYAKECWKGGCDDCEDCEGSYSIDSL